MAYRVGQVRKVATQNYMTDINVQSSDYGLTPGARISQKGVGQTIFSDYAIAATGNTKFNAGQTYYFRFTMERYPFQVFSQSDAQWAELTPELQEYYNAYRELYNGPENIPARGWNYYQHTNDINDPRCIYFRIILYLDTHPTAGEGTEYEVGEYQVISNNLKIQPWLPGKNNQKATFEVVFTPDKVYPYLAFVISRSQVDYFLGARDPFAGQIYTVGSTTITRPRLDLTNSGDIAIVNNVLPLTAQKIGVQTRPGALLCVNREPIRVGKSGTYEVNNGIPISFVSFIAPKGTDNANIDRFILDYAYNE